MSVATTMVPWNVASKFIAATACWSVALWLTWFGPMHVLMTSKCAPRIVASVVECTSDNILPERRGWMFRNARCTCMYQRDIGHRVCRVTVVVVEMVVATVVRKHRVNRSGNLLDLDDHSDRVQYWIEEPVRMCVPHTCIKTNNKILVTHIQTVYNTSCVHRSFFFVSTCVLLL